MKESRFSAFPQHSWMPWSISGQTQRVAHWRGICHLFVMVKVGRTVNRWINRGREKRFKTDAGDACFFPADDEHHAVCSALEPRNDVFCVAIPKNHLTDLAAADEIDASVEFRPLLTIEDAQVRRSLSRLAAALTPGESSDEHARALALRMVELMGGGTPAWHRDRSEFAPTTMNHLVEFIDAHLGSTIPISELSIRTGLSPSHFARKFRRSSGLSLHRFINLRRTRAAISRLQQDEDLARLSLDLGFCSQSHMTRVFREHTGMSPARFRRQFRRTVG